MTRSGLFPVLLLLLGCAAVGCGPTEDRTRVLLVTTTTVEGSGLLDTLVAAYHASQDRYRLATTAVGSGAALALGQRGDADLLLTHDPTGEAAFMEAGHGTRQGPVMRNEFVLAGPTSDPASVRGATDLADAMARIAGANAPFVSRGDESGTHRKERELRTRRGAAPPGSPWPSYIDSGSGMAETLRVADQRGAYVLTDLGTFRHLSERLELEILTRGDPPEPNPYRYTIPTRQTHPEGALHFLEWLLGHGQDVIATWGSDRFGEPLFQPVVGPGAVGDGAAGGVEGADSAAGPGAGATR